MHKLIITAHPSSIGFTHQIAEKLKSLSEVMGDSAEIMDLYQTELKQDYLRYENRKDYQIDEVTKQIQAKITEADELIFIAPIWWGDVPAIMKNFLDCNFTAGFAFQYIDGKALGLLKGKSVRVIMTSGAPGFLYTWVLHISRMWNFVRVSFCGMKLKSYTVFGNMDSRKTDRSKYLEKLSKLV